MFASDVSAERYQERVLQARHAQLERAYTHLQLTQTELLQSQKMASIGQLAAGPTRSIIRSALCSPTCAACKAILSSLFRQWMCETKSHTTRCYLQK